MNSSEIKVPQSSAVLQVNFHTAKLTKNKDGELVIQADIGDQSWAKMVFDAEAFEKLRNAVMYGALDHCNEGRPVVIYGLDSFRNRK